MEEIKVGEYVRTRNGKIGKVYSICEKVTDEAGTYYKYILDIKETLSIQDSEDIVKYSPNIIDLIEEGDFVGNCEIQYIHKNEKGETLLENDNVILKEKDIEFVVTKEQFERCKYEV